MRVAASIRRKTNSMTILQLISSGGFYGTENMLVALSESLSRQGCRVIVGVLRDSRNPHVEVAEAAASLGLTAREIPCDGRFDWNTVRIIRSLVREFRVEAIHAHGYKADLLAFCAVHTIAWPRRTQLVSTCHNWPNPKLRMQTYAKLDRLILKTYNHVTTPSPHVAEILRHAGIREERLTFIRNGVDTHRFENAPPTLRAALRLGERPLIGFVGRLVEPKGGTVLLHAAKKVLKAHPEAAFVLVGDGPEAAAWRSLAASLGIGANVIFAGQHREMAGVYASLDVLVLPSFDEAMPMCLLEAMAAGRAVVATNVGAVPELIENNVTGLLVEPHQVDATAAAITKLLDDSAFRTRLGTAAHAHILRQYSADAMAHTYLGIYGKLPTRVGFTKPLPMVKTSSVRSQA